MAKQTKTKSKRTQVKDLRVTQQELTTDEASKVKGGYTLIELLPLRGRHSAAATPQTSTTSTSLSPIKK